MDTKLYKSLGSLIKDYRHWSDISQEVFAESIGVSVRELRNWETDRHRARTDNLHDISEFSGIPMQVCVALNADQPVWYSLHKRRFAYSSMEESRFSLDELHRYREQPGSEPITKHEPITTERHVSAILSYHREFYGSGRPLGRDVVKNASMILPDLNRIAFDSWGHYVGHFVCLPIKTEVYQQIKKRQIFEGILTAGSIIDITALHGGVFLFYSFFAANSEIAYSLITNSVRYLAKLEQKEKYLIAAYSAALEGKELFPNLGMRTAFISPRTDERMDTEVVPTMYEIEMNYLMRPLGPFGALGWMIKEYDRKMGIENSAGEVKPESSTTNPVQEQNNVSGQYKKDLPGKRTSYDSLIIDKNKLKNEACPNPECTLHGKIRRGNIIFNGTYLTKGGPSSHRFICKECGKSFCSRTGSIFYDLRSPEEKVLMALKLLVKGMPLRGVAEVLEVKLNTVRNWLKVASEQSEKIDHVLMKKLKVSRVDLDALWAFVKKNSLRQRAILWRKERGRATQRGIAATKNDEL